MFWQACILFLALPVAEQHLWVSGKSGNDAHPGTQAAPLQTITAALLAAKDSLDSVQIHVEFGTYDEAHGETYPFVVSGSVTISGYGSNLTEIRSGQADVLVAVKAGAEVTLDGLAFGGAKLGLSIHSKSNQPVQVDLLDCLFATEETGVVVEASEQDRPVISAQIRLQDCRFQMAAVGVEFWGSGAIAADLQRCRFETRRDGVLLNGDVGKAAAVNHQMTFADCVFRGQSAAGIHRRGHAADNLCEQPYRVHGCRFERNSVGLHFEIPSGDSPLRISGCEFFENELYGVRVVGADGERSLRSEIVDSRFQWNGIGLYLVNHSVPLTVSRNHISDNLGAGIFYGNFQVEPTEVVVANCFVGHNGAAGLQFMADGHQLTATVCYNTVVANGRSGIERKDRRRGQSKFEIAYCIVTDNGEDLWNLVAEDLHHCHVGQSELALDDSNLVGDPGFVDPRRRNYALLPESALRNRGQSVLGVGNQDVRGLARDSEPDWGALESHSAPKPRNGQPNH